jgi:ATP-dependent Clp protease protease subunit
MEVRERLNKILANHTGKSMEDIQTDTDRDNFMNAEVSVEYGLIDQVMAQRSTTEEK